MPLQAWEVQPQGLLQRTLMHLTSPISYTNHVMLSIQVAGEGECWEPEGKSAAIHWGKPS